MNFPLSKNCRVNDELVGYNYKINWIECNFNKEQEKEAIKFQFGNNLYINITLKDMFTFGHQSKFDSIDGRDNSDYIVLGNHFLSLFNK